MTNPRRQYRIPSPSELSVELVQPGGSSLRGEVSDLSAQGISLIFSDRQKATCSLKETVHLKIASDEFQKPIFIPSVVRRCEEVTGGWIFGFEFIDWLGLLAQLPPSLKELFNRRNDLRVEPDPENPIEVLFEGLPLNMNAQLRDVSPAGISVYVPSNMETIFRKIKKFRIVFNCPTSPETFVFRGTLLHKNLTEKGICYGILFQPESTEEYRRHQELLSEYIQERKKEILGEPAY